MAFKYYIDTFLVDEPFPVQGLTTNIKFDAQVVGCVINQEANFQWFQDTDLPIGAISAYTYLKDLRREKR